MLGPHSPQGIAHRLTDSTGTAGAIVALAKDLSREKVIGAALAILREQGLGGLSMRQVSTTLGVQPGALYWHVASKQELLAQLAERILSETTAATRPALTLRSCIRTQALEIRAALLAVRDGAEVVSFALALRPLDHSPVAALHHTLSAALPEPDAEWGAHTLAYYILGAVAEEQNRAELRRAGIVDDDHATADTTERFLFGVNVIVDGLAKDGTDVT
jgi:TetR/AcrR family tetracycline transcriptional repressor